MPTTNSWAEETLMGFAFPGLEATGGSQGEDDAGEEGEATMG